MQQAGQIDDRLQRARAALQANRPAEAAQLAQALLGDNAANQDAAKVLGYALITLGRAEAAVASLETTASSSTDGELEALVAVALRRCNRLDDAVAWFERAITRKPPFPASFYELGLVLASLRRYAEAIAVLKRGVEAAPLSPDMVAQLGNLYYAANDRNNAAACYRRALAMNPGYIAAFEALGMVLMQDHDFAQAADIFRRMVAMDPANAHARINLGNCLLGIGDKDGATACFRAASAKGPQYFGKSLRILVGSGRGRFWLKPSVAAKFLSEKV